MQKPAMRSADRLPWDVALFMALYTILPTYFAVEFSEFFPLMTVSRLLLILMGLLLVFRQRKLLFDFKHFKFRNWNLHLTEDKLLSGGLLVYFALILLANLVYITKSSDAIKQLFTIVVEEYAIVWMFSLLLDTRKKLLDALRITVLVSGVVAILGILSVILQFNPFHLLTTVTRYITQATYYRMGLLRAAAGFGHPVYYGAYCAVMVPLSMYFLETAEDRKKRILYSFCMTLNVVCLLLSNSRGSMLALLCIAGIIFLIALLRKELPALLRKYLPILALVLVILLLVVLFATVVPGLVSDFLEGLTPNVTPGTDATGTPEATTPTEPEEEEQPSYEFGENKNGLASRMVQLTAIPYTLEHHPWFGFGANAFALGKVAYTYVKGHLSFIKTVDMNLVAIIGQYGLVGLLAFLSQFGTVSITMLRPKYRKDPLMFALLMAFGCYLLCLLSISNLDRWYYPALGFIVCLVNIIRKEASPEENHTEEA